MATIKQIEKQIETANKRISGFQRKVEMYHARTIKACAAANITIDDIVMTVKTYGTHNIYDVSLPREITSTIGFDSSYRITNNYDSMKANERDLEREKRHLATLVEQRDKMVRDANDYEKATCGLKASLENAMVDFRAVWFEKMRKWHESHFEYINKELQGAITRRNRAYNIIQYFDVTRAWKYRFSSRIYKAIDNIRKGASEIIMDDAANMNHDEYMDKMHRETEMSWNNGITILTNKCHKFGLDENKIRVDAPQMTSKGFSAFITDGKSRIVDVRVIWAAEYSVLVTPHIRYIATQRTK